MRVNPIRVRWIVALAVIASCTAAAAQRVAPFEFDSPVGIVMRLYHDYAFGAVIDQNVPYEPIENEPQAVLERYFDSYLTEKLLEDQRCAKRLGGICNLDFQPMWDSQDMIGTSVEISAGDKQNQVIVALNYNQIAKGRLIYHTVKTSHGWRIHDIQGTRWSLLALLNRPT